MLRLQEKILIFTMMIQKNLLQAIQNLQILTNISIQFRFFTFDLLSIPIISYFLIQEPLILNSDIIIAYMKCSLLNRILFIKSHKSHLSMLQQVQPYLGLFEKYLLAKDKGEFLSSLKPDTKEHKILKLLIDPYTQEKLFKEKLSELGMPEHLSKQIMSFKLLKGIMNPSSEEESAQVLKQIMKQLPENFQLSHPKPIDITNPMQEVQENKVPTEATYEQDVKEHLLKMYKQSVNHFNNFSNYGVRSLDQGFLKELELLQMENFASRGQILCAYSEQFICDFFKYYFEQKKDKNKGFKLPPNVYRSLTISQTNALMKALPYLTNDTQFISFWFKQRYQDRLDRVSKNSVLSLSEKQDKRKLLLEIREELRKIGTVCVRSLEQHTFMELLILDLSLENPKKQLFLQFLQNMHVPSTALSHRFQSKVQDRFSKNSDRGGHWNNVHNYELINWDQDKIISQYLTTLFKKQDDYAAFIKEFSEFLDENMLQKNCARVRLNKGETIENIHSILSNQEVSQIKEKKKISILTKNKKHFAVDQDVVLTIRVKNVKTIKVKIYQLNLEKNYLQKQTKIDQNMNLTFLSPTMSFTYEVDNQNPFKENIYDLPIKEIQKKPAIYIVDLRGDGISSRAVIRKGAIVCLAKTTLAGKELNFFDDDGKRISELSLWIRGNKEEVKGSYTIPFGKKTQEVKIIAVKNNFAELISVTVETQSYSWSIGYIYSSESFIVGNKAKIVVHPRLKLYNEIIGLSLLKNSKISVEMVNSQNIKSYLLFENIKWSSNEDYVLEFPVQAYTKNITINLSADIELFSGGKTTLNNSKQIMINLSEDNNNFVDTYLKKHEENYEIHILGMNGQPIPFNDANVTISLLGISSDVKNKLRSNAEGVIKLGKLPIATSISINGSSKYGNFNKSWRVNDKISEVNYSTTICYKKDEKVSLPIASGLTPQNLTKDFIIIKKNSVNVVFSCITTQATINNGRLEIEDLQEGQYLITCLPFNRKIRIIILGGKQWQASNQVYDSLNGIVYEVKRSANQLVTFGEMQAVQVPQQNKVNLKIPLNLPDSGLSNYLRAHVLLSNYVVPCTAGLFESLAFIENKITTTQTFRLRQSEYFNNKTLSDQGCYVQNRQQEKKFIGNNLEKPHIFLKRIQVRGTNQKDEELSSEGAYLASENSRRQAKTPQISGGVNASLPSLVMNHIESHNNFLLLPGSVIHNLKGETLEFNVPKGYGFLRVYLVSNQSAIQKDFALPFSDPQPKKKDLRHPGLKDQNQKSGWTMSRQSYPLKAEQKRQISRDSHWATVSMANIAAFAELKGSKVPEWVVSWNRYSEEKKLQMYGKHFSHELNTYVKCNDRKFFDKVVRPYICNKISKTFVDLCLLDSEQCLRYAKVQNIQQLNEFQKILLIKYLVDNGSQERAKEIAKAIELRQKINKIPFDIFKQQFDTVINARKSGEQPIVMNQIRNALRGRNLEMATGATFGARQQNMFFQDEMAIIQPMSDNLLGMNQFSNASFGMQQVPYQQASYQQAPMQQMQQRHMHMNLNQMNQLSYANVSIPGPPPPPAAMGDFNFASLPRGFQNANRSTMHSMPSKKAMMSRNVQMMDIMEQQAYIEKKKTYKPGFKQVQKTKEYTETTYEDLKNPSQTKGLVGPSLFWSELAKHIVEKPNQPFLSDSFMYLNTKIQFTLALIFIPNQLNADYDIKNQGEFLQISAKSSFLIFVKQVRPTEYLKKFGVMINQRFFDPNDQYIYEEDGTAMQKEVEEFVVRKIYTIQTVVTNTSGTNLELQILLDIPEGAIPLMSHQYTQILNQNLSAYSTTSFSREFYFPKEGKYAFYPSNACRGKEIIAKAFAIPSIEVKSFQTTRKMESFNDVIHSGSQDDILEFLSKKNVFDYNIFQPNSILWMLKDKKVYEKVINIFKKRCYFNQEVWSYALFHKDLDTIKQFATRMFQMDAKAVEEPPIFEYFPYYSSRTHKFANESKSTIRNVQLKETYSKFLYLSVLKNQFNSSLKLSFVYYLLLQDRIQEASICFESMDEADRNSHKLQSDYFSCFLDMYQGYPNFSQARKISEKYIDYPIEAWRKLFKEIYDILKEYDSAANYVEQEVKTQYKTQVFNQGKSLKISLPPDTKVDVHFFPINLELYFSEFPFSQFKEFSAIKPYKSANLAAQKTSREQRIERPDDGLAKDIIVEVYQSKSGKPAKKVDSIHWTNPQLKVKINEKKGNATVFYKGKQLAGCYCKVYSQGDAGDKFYRDGYTDITGSFKYALADFEKIKKFKILFVTDYGGVTMVAGPPQTGGSFGQNQA